MIDRKAVAATVRFEFLRSLTIGRLMGVLVLAAFPPAITLIVCQMPGAPPVLLPIGVTSLIVCVLGNLLWSTPVVSAELEGRTWLFTASRPGGRLALFLGKWMVAVLWTFGVTWSAVTASMAISTAFQPEADPLWTWGVLSFTSLLGCVAYASTFTLIGILFHRRAMVAAMVYGMVFEVVIGQIPALINVITVRSHLFHLAIHTLAPADVLELPETELVFGKKDLLGHSVALLIIAAVACVISGLVIRFREYLTTNEL